VACHADQACGSPRRSVRGRGFEQLPSSTSRVTTRRFSYTTSAGQIPPALARRKHSWRRASEIGETSTGGHQGVHVRPPWRERRPRPPRKKIPPHQAYRGCRDSSCGPLARHQAAQTARWRACCGRWAITISPVEHAPTASFRRSRVSSLRHSRSGPELVAQHGS